MEKNEQAIELRLLNASYKMVVPTEKEEVYRKAGKTLHERVLYLEKNFKINSREDTLIMASVELLAELMWEGQQEQDLKKRIKQKINNMHQMLVQKSNI